MQLFGIFRSLKFVYIFRSARLSFKAIAIGQNSKSFILRARLFIFTASEPARSPDHFAHLSELWPKTCFRKSLANPYFCTKTAPKNPILKISSPFWFCIVSLYAKTKFFFKNPKNSIFRKIGFLGAQKFSRNITKK